MNKYIFLSLYFPAALAIAFSTFPQYASSAPLSSAIAEAVIPAPAAYFPTSPKNLRDVTYCTMDSVALKMDVYYPQTGSGNWPVVLYVHGGGWTGGDKMDMMDTQYAHALLDAGYVIASVNYRLLPEYPFPAMIEDVKCAVRFLRAHATELELDPERIGAWGTSAGGHLVSLLGLTDQSAGWDVGEYLDQSSRVQVVIDMCGPTDLTKMNTSRKRLATKKSAQMKLASSSPVSYVTPDDPPFLILHGNQDTIVDVRQSELLYRLLVAVGVPAKLVVVRNAGHGFNPVDGPINPSSEEIAQIMVAFLDQYLKPPQ